jgi:hypothetical protein
LVAVVLAVSAPTLAQLEQIPTLRGLFLRVVVAVVVA